MVWCIGGGSGGCSGLGLGWAATKAVGSRDRVGCSGEVVCDEFG